MYLEIAQQKLEQLNELIESDYSISDKSDESDSDSSIHSKIKSNQPKVVNLRRSTRKKEVSFVSIIVSFISIFYFSYIKFDNSISKSQNYLNNMDIFSKY